MIKKIKSYIALSIILLSQQLPYLAEKKEAQLTSETAIDRKTKLFRYLASKGYETDLIQEVI